MIGICAFSTLLSPTEQKHSSKEFSCWLDTFLNPYPIRQGEGPNRIGLRASCTVMVYSLRKNAETWATMRFEKERIRRLATGVTT